MNHERLCGVQLVGSSAMMMGKTSRYLAGAALLVVATTAQAQETPATTTPVAQPSATPTPFVVPPPVVVTVPTPAATPTPRPSPVVTSTPRPTPVATPTPRATERQRPAAAPTPRATATPQPRATPTSQPTPQIAPAAVATPTPEVAPTPVSTPSPTPTTAALPPADEPSRPFWLFPALLVGLVLAAVALFGWRRRKTQEALPAPDYVPVAEPEPVTPVVTPAPVAPVAVMPAPDAPPPPPAPQAPRFLEPGPLPPARLDLDEPSVSRAGVNLVTATADVTVTVRNTSDVTATGIALEVRLLSAQPEQDVAIAALFAEPVERPATPRFDLAPGESKRVRTLATMPRDAITVLQAGERPMFVPVVAIRAVHASGQTTSVHALGIERPGQAKLGPFWLDQPPRMFDAIGVRPHTGR